MVIRWCLGEDVVKEWYSEISNVNFKNIETGQHNGLHHENHMTYVYMVIR